MRLLAKIRGEIKDSWPHNGSKSLKFWILFPEKAENGNSDCQRLKSYQLHPGVLLHRAWRTHATTRTIRARPAIPRL